MINKEIEKSKIQDRKWIIFIFSFPALAVIAGIITIYLVITNPDPEIDKNINRFGLTPALVEKETSLKESIKESEYESEK
jgi:hypothetical protein